MFPPSALHFLFMIFRDSQKKILIAAIFLVPVFIFLNNTGGVRRLKDFSYGMLKNPQSYAAKAAFFLNNAAGYLREAKNLSRENSRLQKENNDLKVEVSKFKETKRENELLRSVLNLPIAREHSLADAAIIGKDPYFFSNTIIINRGSDFQISAGMDAVDSSGYFIGKVAEAGASVSKIRTIFDSFSSVSAIDQETRVQGIVKYDLNDGLMLDMVSQLEKVEEKDTIIAFFKESAATLPIAKVLSVEKFPNKPFQKIKLSPLADFNKLEKVFIVIK